MNDAKTLKKFASDLCVVLPATVEVLTKACETLNKQASANSALEKRASAAEAKEFKFDEARLYKAASAVAKLYGNSLSAEQLFSIYQTNPNALVDSLAKTASHQIGKTITAGLGTVRDMGKDSSSKISKDMDAGSVYMNFRNKR